MREKTWAPASGIACTLAIETWAGNRSHSRGVGSTPSSVSATDLVPPWAMTAIRYYAASYRVGMAKFVEFLGWADLQRPAAELEPYYDVLIELFDRIPAVSDDPVKVRFIGSLDLLPPRLVEAAKRLQDACPEGGRRVTIALAYAGRQEIVDATRELLTALLEQGVPPHELAGRIDADTLARHMYAADLPDPDLVIRTSGEARLSGFLLWQSAYAEYSFVDVFWPAFRRVDFLRALRDFTQRERRFGR